MHRTRIVVGVAVVLALIACGRVVGDRDSGEGDVGAGRAEDVIGGDASPGPTPDGPQALALRIGDPGTVTSDGTEIGRITARNVRERTEPDTELGEAPEFGRFIVVEITAQATGGETFILGPLDFWLWDAEGQQRYAYGDGNAVFSVEADFAHAELGPGEQVTGDIAFDAPAGRLELVYAPGLGSRVLLSWALG
jgi:hypothetical protein